MLLAIDTSGGSALAIMDDTGRILSESRVDDTRRHAELIGVLIRDGLAEAGIVPRDVTGVVAGTGPGPFTGLRVGIAAARVFALGLGVPVHPVVSHDAIALESHREAGPGPLLVVTDARRRERYATVYRGADEHGLPLRDGTPVIARPEALPHPELPRVEDAPVSAARLAEVAALRLAHGLPPDADEALYLRSPDVTPSAGPKRVTA